MPTFAIEYQYDDRDAVRDRVRPAHRAWLRSLLDSGTLVASGPFADGSGALLIAVAETEERLGEIFDADPFHLEGLVAERTVRGWDPVLRSW